MTPERFSQLAQAYGANLQRWPADAQPAAQALLAQGNREAQGALTQARQLDRLLDSHVLPAMDPAFARRLSAAGHDAIAPQASFWGRYAGWLSRAGFVGVGVAGIAAGMLVASMSLTTGGGPEALPSFFDQGDAEIVLNLGNEEGEQ